MGDARDAIEEKRCAKPCSRIHVCACHHRIAIRASWCLTVAGIHSMVAAVVGMTSSSTAVAWAGMVVGMT